MFCKRHFLFLLAFLLVVGGNELSDAAHELLHWNERGARLEWQKLAVVIQNAQHVLVFRGAVSARRGVRLNTAHAHKRSNVLVKLQCDVGAHGGVTVIKRLQRLEQGAERGVVPRVQQQLGLGLAGLHQLQVGGEVVQEAPNGEPRALAAAVQRA